jgi:hypothetical protein
MGVFMDIIAKLSSQIGSRSGEANAEVAKICITNPDLLSEIAAHLSDGNAKLAGDCAEVMTKIAEQCPELIACNAPALFSLLNHKNGRVRWEAAHTIALITREVPSLVRDQLVVLEKIIETDESVIVRDYLLDAIAAYGTTGPHAASTAMPLLRNGLASWESKHAARILRGFEDIVSAAPKLSHEIEKLAHPFTEHSRPGIRKAAKALLKKIDSRNVCP